MSRPIRTYGELSDADGSDLPGQIRSQAERVAERLGEIGHVVGVMSGKGGVGKSFTAAGLAAAAARRGVRTALLDADLGGPTTRRLLGVQRGGLAVERGAVEPAVSAAGVALMSTDLMLPEGTPLEWRGPETDGFVWRGAQERGALREFLSDVAWGSRELLLVDLPPGSDRLVDLSELVPGLAGVVAVTIPSAASGASVERSMARCVRRGIRLLGVIENMGAFACPGCGGLGPLFEGDAADRLARTYEVPLLGRIPFDPSAGALAERGQLEQALEETSAGEAMRAVAATLLARLGVEADGRERDA